MTLLKHIPSGSVMMRGDQPVERVSIGTPGEPLQLYIHNGRIYIYNEAGQTLIDGGFISARAIGAKSITAGRLFTSLRKFTHNLTWTAVDADTCSWNAGVLVLADGTTFPINAGNTGNLTAKNYIYFNGSSTLQKTEYYDSAIGGNNIPLAIIEPTSDPDGLCLITPFVSVGTTIDGDLVVTGKVQSASTQTYFDLNNNLFAIHDGIRYRVMIGKISSYYGIRVSLYGIDASSESDVNKFALWAMSDDSVNNVLIKEKTRGSSSVPTGYANRVQIAHGLGYVPLCMVFVEQSSGNYIKCFGHGTAGGTFYYNVTSTYLTMVNESGSTKTFKYYIFYDQMT